MHFNILSTDPRPSHSASVDCVDLEKFDCNVEMVEINHKSDEDIAIPRHIAVAASFTPTYLQTDL